MSATTEIVDLLHASESFLRAWDAWQRLTAKSELSIGIRLALACDVFRNLQILDSLQNDNSILESGCDPCACLILLEKVPVLFWREVNYLPKGQHSCVPFDTANPFLFSAESIELLRHAAELMHRQVVCFEAPNPATPLPVIATEAKGREAAASEPKKPEVNHIPDWINKLFSQKQFTLLKALWGKESVPDSELIRTLGYGNSSDPTETLRRRISETKKGLLEKSKEIGGNYTIREMTRDGVTYRYLYLDRQKW